MGSYKKKLSIVLLLFLLINFCVCSSASALEYYQTDDAYKIDPYYYLTHYQEDLARIFLTYFEKNASSISKTTFKNYINGEYFFYFFLTRNNDSQMVLYCYIIPTTTNYNNYDTHEIMTTDDMYYDEYMLVPVSGYAIDTNNVMKRAVIIPATGYNVIFDSITSGFFLPTLLINYHNNTVYDYKNGINPSISPWSMLQAAIQENTQSQDETTQAVNNLRNDFNEEESSSDYDFPTDNPTQDTAEASIDSIFTLFYDKINAWSAAQMRIPIPFTGKYFNIPPDLTENIINSFPSGNVITRLLGLIWYYLLGVYIIKDVQKYIDGLQTGEILTKSDTNIKTEML